jgi:hypothetical protein
MDWMDHWDWGGWGCMDITEMQKKINVSMTVWSRINE